MGWLKWPNLVLVVTALYLSTQSQMGYYSSSEWINLGRRNAENVELNIYSSGRIRPGEETPFLLEASGAINLVVGFLGEKQSFSVSFESEGEEAFTLIAPNQTREEVVIEVKTNRGNSKFRPSARCPLCLPKFSCNSHFYNHYLA